MRKLLTSIGRGILALAIILSAVMLISGYHIHAEEAKTVRVSTAKQLKKAMKSEDVGTIIFRTEAYINVTIKADSAAADKFLIIDAENAKVVNKAVFSGIEIQNVKKYTESVSGNKISITGNIDDQRSGFIVSKKKQVERLTIYYPNYLPGYVLRKGAKVKELVITKYAKGAPVELTLNAKNKTVTYNMSNEYDCYEHYKITIDKYGRISHSICESNGVEFAHDFNYKYDSNGNLVEISGWDNENGDFTDTYTYSGGNLVKRVFDDWNILQEDYEYDSKGNKIHAEKYSEDSMDGQVWSYSTTEDYEYDENGRLQYYRYENIEGDYSVEYSYIYNSKGFLSKEYNNYYGLESVYEYTYNKYGDRIKVKTTSDGETIVYEYKYDKLGNLLSAEE